MSQAARGSSPQTCCETPARTARVTLMQILIQRQTQKQYFALYFRRVNLSRKVRRKTYNTTLIFQHLQRTCMHNVFFFLPAKHQLTPRKGPWCQCAKTTSKHWIIHFPLSVSTSLWWLSASLYYSHAELVPLTSPRNAPLRSGPGCPYSRGRLSLPGCFCWPAGCAGKQENLSLSRSEWVSLSVNKRAHIEHFSWMRASGSLLYSYEWGSLSVNKRAHIEHFSWLRASGSLLYSYDTFTKQR